MTDPQPRSRVSALQAVLAVALLAAVSWSAWRTHRLEAAITARLETSDGIHERVERALQLMRLEASTRLDGVDAVIDHVEHWSPQLSSAATNGHKVIEITARLEDAMRAAENLGPGAFDAVERGFAKCEDPEAERWLLRVAIAVDAERGKELCARIARGTKHQPGPITRLRAADELLRADKAMAGDVLREVLEAESAQGLVRRVPSIRQKEYEEYVRGERFPPYFNFISKFVATEHPDTIGVLTALVMRDDHDRMTYQECVKHLGELGAQQAVGRIQDLFQRPPFGRQDPLFQRHCLLALQAIQGTEANPFFERMLQQPQDDLVARTLKTLLKQSPTAATNPR